MEEKIWWYALSNEQKGPVSKDELLILFDQNVINQETLVWKQGITNWIKFSDITALPDNVLQNSPQSNPSQSVSYNQQQPQSSGSNINLNSSGIDSYYMLEFQKIIQSNETYKGKWNWWAFLFGWIWLFTKGAWGIALIILVTIILTFGGKFYLFLIILWAIQCGRRGTWIYYHVKFKNKQMPKSLL